MFSGTNRGRGFAEDRFAEVSNSPLSCELPTGGSRWPQRLYVARVSATLCINMIAPSTRISEIVLSFYDSFDNRDGRTPDFSLFKSHFIEQPSIGNRTNSEVRTWSLREFWEPRYELLTSGRLTEFHEWETDFQTHIFDGIAMRHSTYQKEGLLDGLPYGGVGTKCFQFAQAPDGWRIAYVLWEDQE